MALHCVLCMNTVQCYAVVEMKKSKRKDHGVMTTDDGRLIMDEEEFTAQSQLKEVPRTTLVDV